MDDPWGILLLLVSHLLLHKVQKVDISIFHKAPCHSPAQPFHKLLCFRKIFQAFGCLGLIENKSFFMCYDSASVECRRLSCFEFSGVLYPFFYFIDYYIAWDDTTVVKADVTTLPTCFLRFFFSSIVKTFLSYVFGKWYHILSYYDCICYPFFYFIDYYITVGRQDRSILDNHISYSCGCIKKQEEHKNRHCLTFLHSFSSSPTFPPFVV